MPVWSVASVCAEPTMSLGEWRILETEGGSRHFVGCNLRDYTGRVSTEIQQFDPSQLRGVTLSGRVYQLVGSPGYSADAHYVWQCWCCLNNVMRFTDVTARTIAETEP